MYFCESKVNTYFSILKMCWKLHLNNATGDKHNEPVPWKVISPSNEKKKKKERRDNHLASQKYIQNNTNT